MHALIIEQDAWIIAMIEDALWELGFVTIHCAQSVSDALAFARQHGAGPHHFGRESGRE